MKKRVLQLIGSFHQGGSEKQAIALTRALYDDGRYDVYAATLDASGILASEAAAIGLREIPEYRLTSFYDINFVRQLHRFARYLQRERIHLIHTHDFYTNVFGMAAAKLAGTPVRIASKRETHGLRSKAQQRVERVAFRVADRIVANSNAVADHLTSLGVPRNNVSVIYNGIDVDKFTPAAGASNGRPVVTMVANLRHDVKNIPMLLRLARRAKDSGRNIKFRIAGEGPLEDDLKAMAAELGVNSAIEFVGRCSDVPGLLRQADLCVLTSSAEGFSNALLEYMAAGKPIVTTDVGAAREVIRDGRNGFIVAPDDDAAMFERLAQLVDDADRRQAIGLAARVSVEQKFTREAQLTAITTLYDDLLEKV
jgi:L-malate glycosyltransferase